MQIKEERSSLASFFAWCVTEQGTKTNQAMKFWFVFRRHFGVSPVLDARRKFHQKEFDFLAANDDERYSNCNLPALVLII